MMKNKKILFVTGTRADYAKIRPIFKFLYENTKYDIYIYITGMHLIKKLGNTQYQVEMDLRTNFRNIHLITCKKRILYKNSMIKNFYLMCADFEKVIKKELFDMVFVHGDRLEALATAIVSSVNNVLVCQIEAGEVSGSIDENIRHSITKFSHKFLVNDELALKRVMQLGEPKENIYIIGVTSIQNENSTKKIYNILNKYKVISKKYGILMYHPVTTLNSGDNRKNILNIMLQLSCTENKYIVIYPNNDKYSDEIISVYEKYNNEKFVFYKSLPFDEFKIILENAKFIVGNSSCGLKEAPYYNVQTIDIGSRQANRIIHHNFPSIHHIENLDDIYKKIVEIEHNLIKNELNYKDIGNNFYNKMKEIAKEDSDFWNVNVQKSFIMLEE